MDIIDAPPLFREAWAVQVAFRKLGFSPDKIFLVINTTTHEAAVGLYEDGPQGPPSYVVLCGKISEGIDDAPKRWEKFIAQTRDLPDSFLDVWWRQSAIAKESGEFVRRLFDKGILR